MMIFELTLPKGRSYVDRQLPRILEDGLRRWGLKLSERGGNNAKKRAVVAVARKLSVLLHKLWVSSEVYEPLRNHSAVLGAVA